MLAKVIADAGHVTTIIRVLYSEGVDYSPPILLDFKPNLFQRTTTSQLQGF